MKIVLVLLVFALSSYSLELRTFVPLHFSCVEPKIPTDFGLAEVRLDVFRKGPMFHSQIIITKDKAFVAGYKQAAILEESGQTTLLVPQGNAFQIGDNGQTVELIDVTVAIRQLKSDVVQIAIQHGGRPGVISYAADNCR